MTPCATPTRTTSFTTLPPWIATYTRTTLCVVVLTGVVVVTGGVVVTGVVTVVVTDVVTTGRTVAAMTSDASATLAVVTVR